MSTLFRPVIAWCASLAATLVLCACGGGDGGSLGNTAFTTTPTTISTTVATTTTAVTTSTTGLFLTGISYPLKANDTVQVPAGTQIAMANGTVTTVNAATSSINVPGGTVITVPSSATGVANITVTTLASQPYTLAATVVPTITLIAGSNAGPPVDGVGTGARFWGGGHLAVDRVGNLFLTDGGALKYVSPTGVVTTRAPGFLPYDWEGIAIDAAGTVFGSGASWAPPPNNFGATIQSVSATGVFKTVVSNWTASVTVSTLGGGGLAVDGAGNLFLTEASKHRILKFTPAGAMSVFAGSGVAGASDGTGTAAAFNNPTDLAMDGNGNIFVSDTGNSAIRRITPAGLVTTVAKQLNPGAITSTLAGVVYFIAGSPRTLFRISQDLNWTVSFPLTSLSDPITGLAADNAGNVYAGTLGVRAQIFKFSAF